MPSPYNKEGLIRKKRQRELADNISSYLNKLEEVCVSPMNEVQKAEAFNAVALQVGKLLVSCGELFSLFGVYDETGPRGGKVTKKNKKQNDEDQFEYEEV